MNVSQKENINDDPKLIIKNLIVKVKQNRYQKIIGYFERQLDD
jgi:hypothetical protein